jgi:hypothetical protein
MTRRRLVLEVSAASGPALDDCHFLVHRFAAESGFAWDEAESFVLRRRGGDLTLRLHARAWLTDLWQSPRGDVLVTHAGGSVLHVPAYDEASALAPFVTLAAPGAMMGVVEVGASLAFAWGDAPDGSVMMVREGGSWREVAAPGAVMGVHGCAEGYTYAVGLGGLIARWDGSAWRRLVSPTTAPLARVRVRADGGCYAVGPTGVVLEGSPWGWAVVCQCDAALSDIAVFEGRVFLAGHDAGLLELVGRDVVPIKPALAAERFDDRGSLLIAARHRVVETRDGETFSATPMAAVEALVAGVTPP